MKIFGLFLISCVLAVGQEPAAPAEPPPAEVDQALRARVSEFYQAFVEGKFRKAYLLVSEDSQDAFMESGKDTYKSCEVVKIDFTDKFTKATVLEKCMGIMRWHGTNLPTVVPLTTHWKLQNGDWDWYYVRPTEVMTPWGKAIIRPELENAAPPTNKPVLPDPQVMARMILTSVTVDKESVTLRSWEESKEEVHVRNQMPGPVELKLDVPLQAGFKVYADKTSLGPNEETTITFEYKVDPAVALCPECAKKIHGTATVKLEIEPTGKVFPILVNFQPPPPREQPLAEPEKKK